MALYNVVCCVSMRDVSNVCDLSKADVVPEVREWCEVREEEGGGGVEERRGKRNLEVISDEKNDFLRMNPTGGEE